VVAVLSWPQSSTAQHSSFTQPDLKKLSRDELKACLANPKTCGAADLYAISDELVRRLPELPTQALVECFDDGSRCGVWEDHASRWPIPDELGQRSGPQDACLNIVLEAEASLRPMYPESPQFDRLDERQHYFCGRTKEEGFRVKCASK